MSKNSFFGTDKPLPSLMPMRSLSPLANRNTTPLAINNSEQEKTLTPTVVSSTTVAAPIPTTVIGNPPQMNNTLSQYPAVNKVESTITNCPIPGELLEENKTTTAKFPTPEELDKLGIPKKRPEISPSRVITSADEKRSRSAPRTRVSFEGIEPTSENKNKWSETLNSEKNRETFLKELMSVGYHIISFLEIQDFDKSKKYMCLCSSPRGFYVFCKLPKVTKPDESWIQIKYQKYEELPLIEDIISNWTGPQKFEGFIGLSDKAFCLIDGNITKFYQMLGNNIGDNLNKIKTGDYYLIAISSLENIVKDPGDVQSQVFESIKQLRLRNSELNDTKICEIEDQQNKFKDNLKLLDDILQRNQLTINLVKEKWNSSADRKFFGKMDVLITSNKENCYKGFCDLSKRLNELNMELNNIISDITVNSEQLKALTDC